MGFLDRFKRKEQNVQQPQQSQQPELPFDVQFCMTQDGRLQVDFLINKQISNNFMIRRD